MGKSKLLADKSVSCFAEQRSKHRWRKETSQGSRKHEQDWDWREGKWQLESNGGKLGAKSEQRAVKKEKDEVGGREGGRELKEEGEEGAGSREQGAGSREEGAGRREERGERREGRKRSCSMTT